MRSKTTIVSWTLKPMTVSSAVTKSASNSRPENTEDRERADHQEDVVQQRHDRGGAEPEAESHPQVAEDEQLADADEDRRGSDQLCCRIGPTVRAAAGLAIPESAPRAPPGASANAVPSASGGGVGAAEGLGETDGLADAETEADAAADSDAAGDADGVAEVDATPKPSQMPTARALVRRVPRVATACTVIAEGGVPESCRVLCPRTSGLSVASGHHGGVAEA